MRNFAMILVLIVFGKALFAQSEANIWYFGDQAGLDFSSGEPQLLVNSAMRAEAGCAVISDEKGKLQFYTNGKDVWNYNHQKLTDLSGLNGSQILNQNSMIVPLPGSDHIYYLFTVNASYDSVGLNYTVIDMEKNNGLGEITTRNKFMVKGMVEKITAAEHCNGEDLWIITHDHQNTFFSFLLTDTGIFQDTIKSKTGTLLKGDIGYMKMSPPSNRVAFPVNNEEVIVETFRFNNKSGVISDPVRIFAKDETVYAYGIEFSPNGNLLYVNTGGKAYKVWQYDLSLPTEEEINNSADLLASGNHFAMQLAPDGKIYIAKENRDYLSVINNPNERGTDCFYREFAVSLQGNLCLMGLPNFLSSYFYNPTFDVKNTCLGDTTFFSFSQDVNADSLVWDFDDGSSNPLKNRQSNPFHIYQNTGVYSVNLKIYHCGIYDLVETPLEIYSKPDLSLGNDTSICNNCSIVLNAGEQMDSWLWQDGSESQFYQVWEEGQYYVDVLKNGCSSSDTVQITRSRIKVVVPTAFTPNNDGENDVFKVYSNEVLSNFRFLVFNRWGNIIFETTDSEQGWDGTYNGAGNQSGVYVWMLVFSYYEQSEMKHKNMQGTVMLIK